MTHDGDRLARQHRRRFLILLAVVLAATLVAASEPLHRAIRSILALAQPVIEEHVVLGAVVFVLVSGLSAMVVFFSTALLTPIAVEAYGQTTTVLLLWLGWILGGLTAYAIGRVFGRRVVSWFVDPRRLRDYERRAQSAVSFRHVLLFQLAVPSEIPGYVFGLAGYRFRTFAAAMALGELPFAIGAVYLGASFLDRNYILLFAVGTAGVLLSWLAFRRAAKMWRSTTMAATPPRVPEDPPASASGGVPPYASDSPR
ncbi:MAG: TVP38/TMEM64 family protein [Thermoanaerobaculia bacterium]